MHRLHELFPELRETLPALSLGTPPSPLRPLAGVEVGGTEAWVKDDGAYGDGGWGGNKVRKLEWLIPEAGRLGRETVVTVGGLGTNWGLACALYGKEYGLATVLALVDQPRDSHVEEQLERLRASGAELHFTGSTARTVLKMPWLLARHRRSWFLPAGGSSPVGALGAVETALELAAQVERNEMDAPSRIVTAVGSGGTAAGLVLGLRLAGLDTEVVAVVVNDKLTLNSRTLLRLARKSARLLSERGAELPEIDLDGGNLEVVEEQLGEGYGHRTEAAKKATRAVSQDRLQLDPVYTAKAMAGLLALGGEDLAEGPVVFLNTNGPRT